MSVGKYTDFDLCLSSSSLNIAERGKMACTIRPASQQPSIYLYVYCPKLELESICPNIALIEHNLSENFSLKLGQFF